jgi:hypothetical protein
LMGQALVAGGPPRTRDPVTTTDWTEEGAA